jgi:hypothetical protein
MDEESQALGNTLIRVMQMRFGRLPAVLEANLSDITDRDEFERYFDLAVTCSSIDEFREQAQL